MEAIRTLKPAISNIPKSVSATVAAHANDSVNELGKSDVTAPVYSTKRAKFPQDTFFAPYGPHKPKRSATADRKEAPSANRANRRTISVAFSLRCAAFGFIGCSGEIGTTHSTGMKLSGTGGSARVARRTAQCMDSTPPIRANNVRKAGSWTFATAFVSAIAALRSNDAA